MHESIIIRGAREHNLKNLDIEIPRDELIVVTGLSGSGKSSLAFDTIYAEGQRRYVESLSSYARQFLGQMDKPDLDSIEGLSPAVAIDQKSTSRNPRSTVGTVTEIYDYLRLLFARVGIPHCPECGREILRQTTDQVVDKIIASAANASPSATSITGSASPAASPEGRRALILAPVAIGRKGEYVKLFEELRAEGFARVRVDGEVRSLDEKIELDKKFKHTIEVVVDRIVISPAVTSRIAEAVETATKMAESKVGVLYLATDDEPERLDQYSLALACPEHGHSIDELAPRDFSFNAPYGACPECSGLGFKNEVSPALIIPNPSKSLADGAYVVINNKSNYWPQILRAVAAHLKISIDTPWEDLPAKAQKALLWGLDDTKVRVEYHTVDGRDTHWTIEWEGLVEATMQRYKETTSEVTKQKLEEYLSITPCSACGGARLKPEILAVTVGGRSIYDVTCMSARQSLEFFAHLKLSEREQQIAGRVVKEVLERLRFLVDVGLDYLTLERSAVSLSGGEAQRIRLATQIGAGLMGVLYILDEPSIGLHQRDNERLIATLERLRNLGNTVIVVEHDEETIRAADHVIDIGPGAGERGGYVVAEGTPKQVAAVKDGSLTADYLSGRKQIPIPTARRAPGAGKLVIEGVNENNLKNIDVTLELGTLTVITGVSGSGKSSLVTDTLAPALTNRIHRSHKRVGEHRKIIGVELLDKVIDIDQSPIGRTPRSNPATYVGLWDDVRNLFASLPDSRVRGYSPGRFSFNVGGGRCEACKGDGQIKIEMHFLPDVYVPCEVCDGTRYNRETLQVTYKGKTVADVLAMSVHEALTFFTNIPKLARKLQTLEDVGLGYIKLGQPATTLSGGEAQRVKLSSELQRVQTGRTLYILDEPTTGLHFDDVRQLLEVLERLVDKGNTVLIIEHNLDIIKSADRLIDLGPEGGERGGYVVTKGTPEQVATSKESHTARFLRDLFARDGHAY